jgi:hypothetical protein
MAVIKPEPAMNVIAAADMVETTCKSEAPLLARDVVRALESVCAASEDQMKRVKQLAHP